VKLNFQFIFILGIVLSQDSVFAAEAEYPFTHGDASSFWLSKTPVINPISQNRIFLESGLSFTRSEDQHYWVYPNIDCGLRITNNLVCTAKIFGFSSYNQSPQILGSGFQYFFGNTDTLNWITSIQRIDIKGLKGFSLTSLTVDIRKWINWEFAQFRLGVGSNFYKKNSYQDIITNKINTNGQLNFVGLDIILSILELKFGFNTHVNYNRIMGSIFIQKEFH